MANGNWKGVFKHNYYALFRFSQARLNIIELFALGIQLENMNEKKMTHGNYFVATLCMTTGSNIIAAYKHNKLSVLSTAILGFIPD